MVPEGAPGRYYPICGTNPDLPASGYGKQAAGYLDIEYSISSIRLLNDTTVRCAQNPPIFDRRAAPLHGPCCAVLAVAR
jgi:hypothetical protein